MRALGIHELQSVAEPFDAVFIAVKSYDTEWAVSLALQYLKKPDGVLVDFQNGINDERVAALAGRERCLGCVITIGAGMYEPGHAIRTDPERHRVQDRRARRQGDRSRRAPGQAHVRRGADQGHHQPLGRTVVRSCPSTAWPTALPAYRDWDRRRCERRMCVRRVAIHLAAEAILVGRARGHEVEPIWGIEAQRFVDAAKGRGLEDVERDMAERAKELAGGRPSLLQDVMRGRRTEVQYLNGYVSEQGRQVGVPTPFNDKVVELITRVPPGTLKPDPRNLDPLVGMLSR